MVLVDTVSRTSFRTVLWQMSARMSTHMPALDQATGCSDGRSARTKLYCSSSASATPMLILTVSHLSGWLVGLASAGNSTQLELNSTQISAGNDRQYNISMLVNREECPNCQLLVRRAHARTDACTQDCVRAIVTQAKCKILEPRLFRANTL